MSKQAMVLNGHTYGYYNPASGNFHCTHGAWDDKLEFLSDTECKLSVVGICSYEMLEEIPEDYNYT